MSEEKPHTSDMQDEREAKFKEEVGERALGHEHKPEKCGTCSCTKPQGKPQCIGCMPDFANWSEKAKCEECGGDKQVCLYCGKRESEHKICVFHPIPCPVCTQRTIATHLTPDPGKCTVCFDRALLRIQCTHCGQTGREPGAKPFMCDGKMITRKNCLKCDDYSGCFDESAPKPQPPATIEKAIELLETGKQELNHDFRELADSYKQNPLCKIMLRTGEDFMEAALALLRDLNKTGREPKAEQLQAKAEPQGEVSPYAQDWTPKVQAGQGLSVYLKTRWEGLQITTPTERNLADDIIRAVAEIDRLEKEIGWLRGRLLTELAESDNPQSKPQAEAGKLTYCKEHRTIHCSCQKAEIDRLEKEVEKQKDLKEQLFTSRDKHLERADHLEKELAEAKEEIKQLVFDNAGHTGTIRLRDEYIKYSKAENTQLKAEIDRLKATTLAVKVGELERRILRLQHGEAAYKVSIARLEKELQGTKFKLADKDRANDGYRNDLQTAKKIIDDGDTSLRIASKMYTSEERKNKQLEKELAEAKGKVDCQYEDLLERQRDDIAHLKAQLVDLKDKKEGLEISLEAQTSYGEKATDAFAEAKGKIEQLKRYVRHRPDCPKNSKNLAVAMDSTCTCGLDEAMKEKK